MVTLREISERCKCSVATVSKALNGMPDISAATTHHICEIASEMGYMPNAAARTLKTNRSKTVALMMYLREENVWTHGYFSHIAASIQDVAEQSGYDVTPVNCNRPGLRNNQLNYCRHRSYDGVVVMCAGFDQEDLGELMQSTVPVVTIDYTYPRRSAVLSDNSQGMRELTRYAYEMGHRRIAFIHGEQTVITVERLECFRAACREYGLPILNGYVQPAFYHDPLSAADAAQRLLSLDEPPTCIFFQDDYSYLGCLNLLRDRGVSFPGNVSVAGYDGIRLADMVCPRLTTFHQDSTGIGREAAKMLLKAIEKPRNFTPKVITLPGVLIPGETIRPPCG